MPLNVIQASFAGGEFAPSLYARVDIQKYSTGVKKATNFIVHPHGPVSNRPGTKYISTAKFSNKKCRIMPFEFSVEQAYTIEFGEGYCRFYKDGGQIQKSSAAAWQTSTAYVVGNFVTQSGTMYYCIVAHTSGTFATDLGAGKWVAQTTYEIPTPYLEADLPDIKIAQSADTLYICHQDHAPRTLSRLDHDNWELALYPFTGGPFMLSNAGATTLTPSGTTGSITLTASASLFNTLHVGSLWRLVHQMPGQVVSASLSATGQSSSIKCGGTWRIITHGTWTAKFRIEKSTDGGSTWKELRTFTGAADFNANTFGEVDEPCLIRVNCYSYTSGTLNADLTSDPFEQTGIVKVTAFTSATQVTATVVQTVGDTSAIADWAEGSWSDYRGWPGSVTFYQDRLMFGATPSEPQTGWLTETGNYTSFARSNPLVDSDGITINLPSRKMNGIKSLVNLSDILALTSSSEWGIGSSTQGAITPTTVYTRLYEQRGCNYVDPVVVGNRAIYIQPQGTVVRDIGFEQDSQGFTGSDLSILSNHLFKSREIIGLAYQQEPDSLVWAVRDDGVLLSLTYMREHDVVAWTPHETDGDVESICVIPGDEQDELWMVVKRGAARFIELMMPRLISNDPRDQFFVDCGLSLDNPKTITGATQANPVVITSTAHGFNNGDIVSILDVEGMTQLNGRKFIVSNKAANTFELKDEDGNAVNGTAYGAYVSGGELRAVVSVVSGLSHLNGKTVAILADGDVQPKQVVSGGQITLSPAASIVHVGLPYTATLETLRPELGLKDGTTQTRKVSISKTIIRFLNSRGGWAGPGEGKLKEIIQRTSEPLGSPIELKTEDHHLTVLPTWETGGIVRYEQRDPLPVTILAVMLNLTVGG